jgi:16S rRNA G966 N2-methylase RsmD
MNNNTIKLMFSKKSDDWATPSKLYKQFIDNGYFDPCPLHSKTDNLNNLYEYDMIFINPPYSNIKPWVDFAIKHINYLTEQVIMLVPARTDTKWFHYALEHGALVKFIKGRLSFNDIGKAPFPSIYLIFNK